MKIKKIPCPKFEFEKSLEIKSLKNNDFTMIFGIHRLIFLIRDIVIDLLYAGSKGDWVLRYASLFFRVFDGICTTHGG